MELAEVQTQFQHSAILFAAIITQLLYDPQYLFPFNLGTYFLFLIHTRLKKQKRFCSVSGSCFCFAVPPNKDACFVTDLWHLGACAEFLQKIEPAGCPVLLTH